MWCIKRSRKVYDEISVMECELAMCSSDEIVYITKLYTALRLN